MPDLTFIMPVGPLHERLAQRAIASVEAQTVPCALLTAHDTDHRGPGTLRNELLRKVETEFVSFLDADDWVELTFAEETIAEYRRIGGGSYIFTDWLDEHGNVITAPCYNPADGPTISKPGAKPYCGGTWHAITTLIPTAWAKETLFDETLPAIEDTDFYVRLCITMHCAHHLARPLFHYSPDGSRGASFRSSPDRPRIQRELSLRYGGQMGCCGDDPKVIPPVGAREPGDVLAMALWNGNRSEYGRATQRHYPRISRPRTAWVDPRDVAQSPMLWRIVEQPHPVAVDSPAGITNLAQMAAAAMVTVHKEHNPYAAPLNEPPVPPIEAKPDVARVLRLARNAKQGDPVFVFSDKPYPSYSDFRRLVELSGFRSVPISKVDVFSRAPLIVVTPEPIGDRFRGVSARVICWQLEYAGDYTGNYAEFGGEVWASDKAWADAHGAKYVLLGSHPDLLEHLGSGPIYDVTMLGYMTPRRQALKDALSDLRWPIDYPGHDTRERGLILNNTRLMLNVHQHDDAPFVAPQRIAIAAAYKMPVNSERVKDIGLLAGYIFECSYEDIPDYARKTLEIDSVAGNALHEYLCIERPFRRCVEEALKA